MRKIIFLIMLMLIFFISCSSNTTTDGANTTGDEKEVVNLFEDLDATIEKMNKDIIGTWFWQRVYNYDISYITFMEDFTAKVHDSENNYEDITWSIHKDSMEREGVIYNYPVLTVSINDFYLDPNLRSDDQGLNEDGYIKEGYKETYMIFKTGDEEISMEFMSCVINGKEDGESFSGIDSKLIKELK